MEALGYGNIPYLLLLSLKMFTYSDFKNNKHVLFVKLENLFICFHNLQIQNDFSIMMTIDAHERIHEELGKDCKIIVYGNFILEMT